MIFLFRTMRTRNNLARDLGCTVENTGALLWKARHFVDRIQPQTQMLVIPEEPIFEELIRKARRLPYTLRAIPMGARFYEMPRSVSLLL